MEKYAGTQSLARAFQLIKSFDDQHPILSLPQLIERSGLKRTTVFRMLAALEAEGIVRKTLTGEYVLGPELIMLGGRAIRSNNIRMVALPYLQQLVFETAESVTIDILWVDDHYRPMSMVIEEQLGRHVMGMSQYIGGRFPAHTTSTGKVLLAWQTNQFISHLDLDQLDLPTSHTISSKDKLLAELAHVKAQGFAITRDELEIGLTAIAAPIFNTHAEPQAALCIAAPSSRLPADKMAVLTEKLTMTAAQISQAIGYPAQNSG